MLHLAHCSRCTWNSAVASSLANSICTSLLKLLLLLLPLTNSHWQNALNAGDCCRYLCAGAMSSCVPHVSAAQQALQRTGCWCDTPPPRPAPWQHHPGRKQDTSAGTQESMGFRSRWGLGVNVPETQPAAPVLCRPPPPRLQPRPWRATARRRHLRRCCSVSAAAKRSCGGLLTRMPKQQAEGLHSNVATVRYCNHPWLTPLKVPKHDTLIWNSSSFPIFPPRALREALWRGRAGAQPG